MVTSFSEQVVITALLLGLSVACSTDNEDCGNGNEALDNTGSASDGATCACTRVELVPGSSALAGKVDLDCFCRAYGCLNYEQSHLCGDEAGPATSISTYAGCNMVSVDSGGGFSGTAFTYDATCHELLGAYSFSDNAMLDCSGERVHAIVAGVFVPRDFPDCEQGEARRLCQ
jgi:hypothetical protein